jgi:purine catabolism regulator
MLEDGRPAEEIDLLALDRAAAAVGLALLSEREAANLAEHASGALITDALHGRYASSAEILRRARGLGADFTGQKLVALALEVIGLADRDVSDVERQRVRTLVLREVKAAAKAAGSVALAALERDLALCLVGVPEGANPRQVADRIGGELLHRLGERSERVDVAIGASGEADEDSVRRALEEASEAVAYGTRTGADGVQHFPDLGVHHLLVRLADGPELARFVESQLAPLLAHEAKASSPLLPTLQAFLDNGGVKSTTAQALHIERMSLYHRLHRIERLLGRGLADSETRTQLDIALRGLDILRKRSSRSRLSPGA